MRFYRNPTIRPWKLLFHKHNSAETTREMNSRPQAKMIFSLIKEREIIFAKMQNIFRLKGNSKDEQLNFFVVG